MKLVQTLFVVFLLVLTVFCDIYAQKENIVISGAKVRIRTFSFPKSVKGKIMSLSADTLRLKAENRSSPMVIPVASLASMELTFGKKSKIVTGLVSGFLVGACAGVVVGELCDSCNEFANNDPIPYHLLPIGTFGGIGLVLGTGIGAAIKVERWQSVDLNELR